MIGSLFYTCKGSKQSQLQGSITRSSSYTYTFYFFHVIDFHKEPKVTDKAGSFNVKPVVKDEK